MLGSLVAADQASWLPMSVRELQATTDQLRLIDLRRAAAAPYFGITEAFLLDPEALSPRSRPRSTTPGGRCSTIGAACSSSRSPTSEVSLTLAISALGRRSTLLKEALSFISSDGGSTVRPPEAS